MVVACEKMTRGMLGPRVGGGGMGKGRNGGEHNWQCNFKQMHKCP